MTKNFMSSILDELMGRNRNALPTDQPTQPQWDDPEICTHYLVCFCPHELFVNTKADLGPCPRMHDDQLRKKYQEEAPSYKKTLFETDFIRSAEKMIADIEGKIKRGKMRIALANGPDGGTYAGPGSKNAEKIALLSERINQVLEEAETAGCEGDVEKAQSLMKLVEELKSERDQLKANELNHPWNPDKAMQVCEVCGSYLIIGEAQHRLDDHIMGKQHVGFARLRKKLEEIKEARVKRDEEDKAKLEKSRDRRNGGNFSGTDRNRDRDRKRLDDRGRRDDRFDKRHSKKSRSRSKSPKSGHKRHASRDKDKDSKHDSHRRHSKDRKRSRRSRSRSRSKNSDRCKQRSRSKSHDTKKDTNRSSEPDKGKTSDKESSS